MPEFYYPSQLKAVKSTFDPNVKRNLHKAAINAIISDGLSFGIFRKPGMKKFISVIKPGYFGPHRKTVRRLLSINYFKNRNRLKNHLSKITKIALTSDCWRSNAATDFICLTGHFFNHLFEYKSIVFGFRNVIGQHTSANLKAYIEYELKSLDISPIKISSITTDNAQDIKNATSVGFGIRIGCLCHILNLVVQNGLELWTTKK